MGKLTLGSYDEVLRDKLKTIISSAVKQAEDDEGQPVISYETFVEELDVCDSFTSSLIHILAKEIADRRTRPTAVDRRLISQDTADDLRIQAESRNVYRRRSTRLGSRWPFADPGFTLPATPSDEEEDPLAAHDPPTDTMATMYPEGVRLNTELFDALSPFNRDLHGGPMPYGSSTRDGERILDVVRSPRPRPYSPPFMSSRRHPSAPSGTSLTRQSSIRRPPRSRTSDFSDFTSRRRSIIRESLDRRDSDARTDDVSTFPSGPVYVQEQSDADDLPPPPRRRPRRFFLSSGSAPVESSVRESAPSSSAHAAFVPTSHQSSADLWYSLTSGASSSSSSPNPSQMAGGRRVIPRLRRGGLAAPESLQTQLPNTSMDDLLAGLSSTREYGASTAGPATATAAVVAARTREDGGQLLTPRSISPAEQS